MMAGRLAAAVLALAFAGCRGGEQSEEKRVKSFVEECVRLAEERKPGPLSERLSEAFSDNHGNDRKTLHAILARELLAGNWLKIATRDLTVNIRPDRVDVSLKLLAARGGAGMTPGSLLPQSGGSYDVKAVLDRKEDGYVITSAEWEETSSVGMPEGLK